MPDVMLDRAEVPAQISATTPAIMDVIRGANGLFEMPRRWLPDGDYGGPRSANDVRRPASAQGRPS